MFQPTRFHLLSLLAFAGSLAHAAPLIGTPASFANSSFCRDYGCTLVDMDARGPDWQDIQQKYLHHLGNLTLPGCNSELSDRPFAHY